MKNGFHPEIALAGEIQRGDENVPLKFAGPSMGFRKRYKLPEDYCKTCTLREGVICTMVIFQTMTLGCIIVMSMFVLFFDKETTEWWEERFRHDFDYYYQNENEKLRKDLVPLWRPFAYAIIIAHVLLFVGGWMVVFAVRHKHSSPYCYLPWIVMSCLLVASLWVTSVLLILAAFVLLFFREISVMWDLCPIALSMLWAYIWTYSTSVVIAHYRRRCIVKFWRSKRNLLGTENYPPEVTDYLVNFAKSS